ncbi:hypothetical protein RQP46_005035 [Phenoliferia psychrophenolica]
MSAASSSSESPRDTAIITSRDANYSETLDPDAAPTEIGKKDETIQIGEQAEPFLVTLAGREHLSPYSWSARYRWMLTAFAGLLMFVATFASSAPSNLIPAIIEDLHVSEEVGILTISIFVAGYCLGPLFWGPLSERNGRRNILIAAFIPYLAFQLGAALAPNVAALLVFRFLGGAFASAPLTSSGGVCADLWEADKRGKALAIFALMPFAGPSLAPIISGFMFVAGANWRWIFWILTIIAGVCLVGIFFLLPETYEPRILHQEAKRLRESTGDSRWHSALDYGHETLHDVLRRTWRSVRAKLKRDVFRILTAQHSHFAHTKDDAGRSRSSLRVKHGLNSGESGLVFLSFLAGCSIGVLAYGGYYNKRYAKLHYELAPKVVPPEVRLRPLFVGAPAMAIDLFWIAGTSSSSISIASPICGIFVVGLGILFCFLGYLRQTASALAINTVFRKLGTPGAVSLLGGIATLFVPVPFVLTRYGKRLRGMSKNAIVRTDE